MTKANVTAGERPYHHGDLHRAIVTAALEVLSETQSTEFSLRELARRAGVSHNAPYKHFADKRELLAAVSAVGFELLAKRMTDAMQATEQSPCTAIRLGARVCSPWRREPSPLQIDVRRLPYRPGRWPPCHRNSCSRADEGTARGRDHRRCSGTPIPNTPRNERKIAGAILIFWSQMHGLTLLLVDQLVGPNGKSDELSESVLQGMLDGLARRIPALPPGTWVGPQMPSK